MSWVESLREGRIKVGTTAIHKMGDISRPVDLELSQRLFVTQSETEADYIGNWVAGFGFIDVRFPKETVRELTAGEAESLVDARWRIV
jgi:hypothetical protein